MRTIKVTFEDGDTIITNINGTDAEIRAYYLGNEFNIGNGEKDNVQMAVKIEYLN